MKTAPLTAEQLQGIALTIMLAAGFAAGWGLSGSAALPGVAATVAMLLVLAITALWFGLAFALFRAARQLPAAPQPTGNPFRSRAYQLAVVAEIIAIPLAGWLLTTTGYPDAIMPAVAAIVGLHFFGLIPAFRSWRFAGIGGAMVLLALVSLALAPSVPLAPSGERLGLRAAVVGLGCALILWAGIAPVVAGARRQLAQTPPDALNGEAPRTARSR